MGICFRGADFPSVMKTEFLLFIIIFGSNTQQSTGKPPERRKRFFSHCNKLKHEDAEQQIHMRIFLNAPAYLFRLVSRMTRPEKASALTFISEGKGGLYSFLQKQIRKILYQISFESVHFLNRDVQDEQDYPAYPVHLCQFSTEIQSFCTAFFRHAIRHSGCLFL